MIEVAMNWKTGGCHCGMVRFAVLAPDEVEVKECNCSVCRMTGFIHLIVEADRFRLLSGEDKLTTYRFNTGTAKHHFCSLCGIKSFYVPRSKPDGFSVNVRCLDPARPPSRVPLCSTGSIGRSRWRRLPR